MAEAYRLAFTDARSKKIRLRRTKKFPAQYGLGGII